MMVEFDTFVDTDYDPPVQHIGININSLSSLVYPSWDPESQSGNATNVVVTYNCTISPPQEIVVLTMAPKATRRHMHMLDLWMEHDEHESQ